MDESRFGLLSIQRRCLTARGVKPVIPYQHRFNNCYLFGAYAPGSGDHFTLELPYCNSDCFQVWLDKFSVHKAAEFKVVILDNGAFHKSGRLKVPGNMSLLFLPPYCPELNPSELIWGWMKNKLGNKVYTTLAVLSEALGGIVKELSPAMIRSITGWKLYTNTTILDV
jgi:transposase